jgi:hypothetical protein
MVANLPLPDYAWVARYPPRIGVKGIDSHVHSHKILSSPNSNDFSFELLRQTHPDLPWCRYADDGLVHCRNEQEAQALKDRTMRLRCVPQRRHR